MRACYSTAMDYQQSCEVHPSTHPSRGERVARADNPSWERADRRARLGVEGGPAREAIDLGDRAKMESCVREIFALREAGDIAGMAQLVTDDIVVFPPTTWGYATFPRTIAGRMAVAEAFTHRNVQYENLGSTIHKLLIDGEWAVVHRTSTIRERGGSRQYTYDAVDFFRFRDGLVCEFSEFPDGTLKDATENFPL